MSPASDGHGRELLTADQLAAILGKNKRWVYRQKERGLPYFKLGNENAYRIDLVEKWLTRHLVGAAEET